MWFCQTLRLAPCPKPSLPGETPRLDMNILLEDDGTLKDFPHIKETNHVLLKNYKMMENMGGKMDILSYDLKNFNKTIPSHMVVKLC